MNRFITIILLAGTTVSIYPLETVPFEEALWSQVQALSAADFKKTVKEEVKDHKSWKKTIDETFHKLLTNSGNPNFDLQYAVIKDPSFNAFAFPGGQFIIHTELLDELDRLIQKDNSIKPNSPELK